MCQDAKGLSDALCIPQNDAKEHAIKFIFRVGQDVFPSGMLQMATVEGRAACRGSGFQTPCSLGLTTNTFPNAVKFIYAESRREIFLHPVGLRAHPKRQRISGAGSISWCRRPGRRVFLSG